MKPANPMSWIIIRNEFKRRIIDREWTPGAILPTEADLALEFGCARATVNRAMQALAAEGLLERRRKAGTRVTLNPVRKATLDIPIIRTEVEKRGMVYSQRILSRQNISKRSAIENGCDYHIQSLHLGDGIPFAFEDRRVNTTAVPGFENLDFSNISVNEWLVQNAPYSGGDIAFSAQNATPEQAVVLQIAPKTALFVIDRKTWNGDTTITLVRLSYAPGFKMDTQL